MYELPLFTAELIVPEYVAISDGSFPVTVKVDYTFGKTMRGRAVVTFFRFSSMPIYERTITLGTDSNVFRVDIARDLGIVGEEQVDILLDFTDAMTDTKLDAIAYTIVRTISTVLEVDAPERFRRDQIFEFDIIAMRYDNKPVS